ncbi:DUF2634 domain-containing protein [Terrisporobacter hibernicus]|uniref:DUF2634 domain-containing protein n=1 Tax=Terrisporobacter hibernicus TaxID=2813371 RepID=A0AAX2ZG13_9FIRM|nr:DUF2634 domain-containing protein [Terrisporobacter hibernicus]UEL47360.1 DUF2634 domain-containing protein [Terrisporobacter hibernicus]
MDLFPFIDELEEDEDIETIEEALPLLKEVAWNFEQDKPIINSNGTVEFVEGIEALKIWIYKAIKINRYEHEIYSWDYGCEINELIGESIYSRDHIELESQRYIEECLLINPYINSISFDEIRYENGIVKATFQVDSYYGEVDISV